MRVFDGIGNEWRGARCAWEWFACWPAVLTTIERNARKSWNENENFVVLFRFEAQTPNTTLKLKESMCMVHKNDVCLRQYWKSAENAEMWSLCVCLERMKPWAFIPIGLLFLTLFFPFHSMQFAVCSFSLACLSPLYIFAYIYSVLFGWSFRPSICRIYFSPSRIFTLQKHFRFPFPPSLNLPLSLANLASFPLYSRLASVYLTCEHYRAL